MKASIALLLLAVGAGSVWAYGMMGGGMMGRASDAQGFWAYMASMHNWMHGTNYTTDQFRQEMQDWNGAVPGSGARGMMGSRGGMMGGYDNDDGPRWGAGGCH